MRGEKKRGRKRERERGGKRERGREGKEEREGERGKEDREGERGVGRLERRRGKESVSGEGRRRGSVVGRGRRVCVKVAEGSKEMMGTSVLGNLSVNNIYHFLYIPSKNFPYTQAKMHVSIHTCLSELYM